MVLTRLSRTILAAAAISAALSGTAAAVNDPTGIWTLSAPGTPRQCRIQFRADPVATGQAVAMPPGCRRAFPILASVRSWSVPDGVHLALSDEVGANVLMFGEVGDGRLQAAGPESEAAYVLAPLGVRRDAAADPSPATPDPFSVAPVAVAPPVAAEPVAPIRAPASVAKLAGHYAVMRGSRDTGCMVTLDDPGRNTPAGLKARLAPACRDQGIIVFDPVGWSLKAGHLVLAARRGHTAIFSEDEAGTWIKDPTNGQPLGLKRL